MNRPSSLRATNGSRLERWISPEEVERISNACRTWYGPPIPVASVPGEVYVTRGGDFVGEIKGGSFASLLDYRVERFRRAFQRWGKAQRRTASMAGFSSLSDLISEATAGGKRRSFPFQKVGTTGVIGSANSLWRVGNMPTAGGAASAAPGGDALTDASTGAFPFANPTGGDTQHVVRADYLGSVAGNTLLLYDRIFQVGKTMSSTTTEAVTGVPTRYQSTTPGDIDSAEGNFLFPEIQGALGATAHNWTVCQYQDQAGNATENLPSFAGINGGIINRLDFNAAQTWFAPLNAGDTGVRQLKQMQCDASVTGTLAFVIGHPLAFFPVPLANNMLIWDGINSAFSLVRVFDDAALALLEISKSATTATTYTGMIDTVSG
jgi:hypothetical protein